MRRPRSDGNLLCSTPVSALMHPNPGTRPELFMQDRVDFSHSRCSPCPAAWLGWPRVPGVVRNKQRHQGVPLLSSFLLENLVTVPISSSLSPNTCQPAPVEIAHEWEYLISVFNLHQAFQHRVPGDDIVCPGSVDGHDGGLRIEVCESLHHVCDALASCPCGLRILEKGRASASVETCCAVVRATKRRRMSPTTVHQLRRLASQVL